MEEFSRIHGVGDVKLEQYGPEFLEVIRGYSEVNGLPNRTGVSVKRQQPESRRGATYNETKSLLAQKLSVSQIAQQRNLAETTIIGHLERMAGQGLILDLEHLLPSAEKLDNITEAFDVCGSDLLRPVWEFLGTQYAPTMSCGWRGSICARRRCCRTDDDISLRPKQLGGAPGSRDRIAWIG